MKFWITCTIADDYKNYMIHAIRPEWNRDGGRWLSSGMLYACSVHLKIFLGKDYDLPKPDECWEFTTEETIWIHTPGD